MQPLLEGGFICGQQNMKPQSKLKLELSLSVATVHSGCVRWAAWAAAFAWLIGIFIMHKTRLANFTE